MKEIQYTAPFNYTGGRCTANCLVIKKQSKCYQKRIEAQ